MVPVGESVRAEHSPTVVEGVLGFLPVLNRVEEFVEFVSTEVGDVPAIVGEGGKVGGFWSFRFCNHREAIKGGGEGVPRSGGGIEGRHC